MDRETKCTIAAVLSSSIILAAFKLFFDWVKVL